MKKLGPKGSRILKIIYICCIAIWVTVKFFTVIGLILFGMFFLEDLMLTNLDLLINGQATLSDPFFL